MIEQMPDDKFNRESITPEVKVSELKELGVKANIPPLRVRTAQIEQKTEPPLWQCSPKSESVMFLEAKLESHCKNDLRHTRDVHMHQMLVKSTIVQYDRLYRILEKTKKDHALYI